MATKIDIISGFLGAGKTTLIKKLLKEAYADEQVVLIENEFGEIGIDGGFLKEAGIQIREMNSGCICCSLVGDFGTSLKEVVDKYHPDRILIEPSGVGKLSDVIKAVQGVQGDVDIVLNSYTTVVDAKKCKMYMRNFGEFFNNQVEYAGAIIMSRTDIIDEKKAQQAMELLRGINAKAAIITTPIEKLDGKKILEVMEKPVSLEEELMAEEEVCPECGHVHEHGEHHHHDHDDECGCGHDHDEHEHHHDHDEHEHHHDECGCDHDHDEHEHHHDHEGHEHHHDHDDECGCGHDHDEHEHHHEHHHDHDHECGCGHDHHDHHHHHADEVFTSWGRETIKKYTREGLEKMLEALSASEDYGIILRAKGMLPAEDGTWIYFDMVPEETEIREGAPEYTGRLCVIGSKLKEDKLAELFGLAE
jgi:G3E family GTPase